MKVSSTKGPAAKVAADVLVVPVFDGERADKAPLRDIDRALGGELAAALERGELGGASDPAVWPGGELAASRVLFLGAGPKADADADTMRALAGTAARRTRKTFGAAAFLLRADAHAEAVAEGFLLGDYEPDLYAKTRAAGKLTSLAVIATGDVRKAVDAGCILAECTNLARDLVNEPPNAMTPTILAKRAREELTPLGVKVDVMTGKQLAKFGALLGVAKGSDEPPVFVTMSWTPPRAKAGAVLGLVGKGITFDSGGLSLKPNDGMQWMKGDMAGAAAVICAMKAIATLKVPVRVTAVVPSTENMPSGKATRVGDVLTAYSGKTIEVLNTDAEGRLILADGLAWLAEQGVTHMVDVATLTGAVEVALGKVAYGVMGRPDAFVDKVLRSSRRAGEKAWPLPLYKEYRDQLRSELADIKNVGGRAGGTITAGWFLSEFVPADVHWAHLDIAGVAWADKNASRSAGATGAAVRALTRVAQDLA